MQTIIEVKNLKKIYKDNKVALDNVNLDIFKGEIIALLGPNGAGKTTLISNICGISSITSGNISVSGFDVVDDFREARKCIGIVPQELSFEPFEKVINTVKFSRELFGKKPDPKYIENLLKKLSLWDKKDQIIRSLSGGMKRRVLIAKALSHEPDILFLDEPTAGVDVELRKDMWKTIKNLQKSGVTIILTTHYIEEAELMANRIAVINNGKILLIDKKDNLKKWNIVGPICESSDFLAKNISLDVNEDDLIAIKNAGAYGFVMASNYNSRPKVCEILVDQNESKIIRERETLDDLLEKEKIVND